MSWQQRVHACIERLYRGTFLARICWGPYLRASNHTASNQPSTVRHGLARHGSAQVFIRPGPAREVSARIFQRHGPARFFWHGLSFGTDRHGTARYIPDNDPTFPPGTRRVTWYVWGVAKFHDKIGTPWLAVIALLLLCLGVIGQGSKFH